MMKALFGDFSKWHFLVLATLHRYHCKTSGPILIIFCVILMINQCYVLCRKNLKSAESIHVTHFGIDRSIDS